MDGHTNGFDGIRSLWVGLVLHYRDDMQFVDIGVVVVSEVIDLVPVDLVGIAEQGEAVGDILVGREREGKRSP